MNVGYIVLGLIAVIAFVIAFVKMNAFTKDTATYAQIPECLECVERRQETPFADGYESGYAARDRELRCSDRQFQKYERFLRVGAQSGLLDVPYILGEMAKVSDLDSAKAMRQETNCQASDSTTWSVETMSPSRGPWARP